MRSSLQKQEDTLCYFIRAAAVIPSFHSAVEELLLNSLDANASKITITVNLRLFNVTVEDNGCGIAERNLKEDVAQWSYTGKHFGYNSYGMKGEALAALKELSEMEIMSCTEDSTGTLVKKFCGTNDIYKVYDTDRSKSGTKVMIKNLFHNVPVRQASTRSILELNLIKEFIKNMSVLHHQVSWNLIDSATKMKNVIKLDLESSVAARFASYHGEHVLNRMKRIRFDYHNYYVEGLMSPVFSSACHWNKEYQYFYINNRWVKGKDPSTAIINQIYSALLRQQQFGPTAQHSEANRNVFPCFVLQLKCAVDKYDILVEPDKSFPIFCDSASIERCSYGLVHHIISTHNPEMLETLIKQEIFPIDDSYDTSNDSEPVMEISYPVSSTQETSSNSGVSEPFLPYQVSIVKKSDARQSNSSNYQNSMDQYRYDQCISPPPILDFDTAFFGGESKYKRNYKKRKPAAASNNWRLRQELLPSIKSLAKLDSWEAGMEDYFSETESLSPLIRKEAISSAIGVTVKRLGSFSSIFDSYRQPSLRETEPIQIANPNQHTEVQQEEQDLRSTQNPQSQKKKDSNNFQFSENENTSALDVTRFTVHDHQQRFLRGKTFESPPREVTELVERNSFQASENLSLSKNKLKKIQFIGQCDNKYLLGYEKYHGLLVAFDQHAVDERINFEKFQKRLNEEIWMNDLKSIKILPQPLYIQKDRLDLLDAYSQLFQRWKFSFELSNCSGENTQVMLSEVPIISGEPLDSKDFLEFFHFVYKNGDVPEQLLRPPAVNRILASKACRLSIKFGDNLEEANCRDLLETLSQTDCPFYCAHGRPAVIPLLSLVESKKVEFLKKNTSQSNKNRFKPNYQNAIESLKKCKRK